MKPEYLVALRATAGVIAGVASFNYDEIIQLRTAVSEVFNLAIKHVTPGERISEVHELDVRFLVQPDKIEIVIAGPKDYTSYLNTEQGRESLALLGSLMDKLDVRFLVQPDKIETVIAGPKDYTSYLNTEQERESLALLGSLMDEVEFGAEVVGKTVVRMVKYKSSLGEP